MTFKKTTDEHGDWLCTDTRKWPIKKWHEHETHYEGPFGDFYSRVANLIVESGWEITVIWGTGTYSDNHYADIEGREFNNEPKVVEVGLWNRDGDMQGDPAGWVTQEDFAAFMDLINTLPCDWKGEVQTLIELKEHNDN